MAAVETTAAAIDTTAAVIDTTAAVIETTAALVEKTPEAEVATTTSASTMNTTTEKPGCCVEWISSPFKATKLTVVDSEDCKEIMHRSGEFVYRRRHWFDKTCPKAAGEAEERAGPPHHCANFGGSHAVEDDEQSTPRSTDDPQKWKNDAIPWRVKRDGRSVKIVYIAQHGCAVAVFFKETSSADEPDVRGIVDGYKLIDTEGKVMLRMTDWHGAKSHDGSYWERKGDRMCGGYSLAPASARSECEIFNTRYVRKSNCRDAPPGYLCDSDGHCGSNRLKNCGSKSLYYKGTWKYGGKASVCRADRRDRTRDGRDTVQRSWKRYKEACKLACENYGWGPEFTIESNYTNGRSLKRCYGFEWDRRRRNCELWTVPIEYVGKYRSRRRSRHNSQYECVVRKS